MLFDSVLYYRNEPTATDVPMHRHITSWYWFPFKRTSLAGVGFHSSAERENIGAVSVERRHVLETWSSHCHEWNVRLVGSKSF